ncbi:hypothetical protein TNCT_481441 [Trichonephila clavata]|uniref:Uncharacterized protein n=1 Tax=Trichonephila clavata TaxID=2740835 RepID=A0A8X6FEK3_TRICU|nr:hypothetical protein TNCT_481441 [Trichonephila clavata]
MYGILVNDVMGYYLLTPNSGVPEPWILHQRSPIAVFQHGTSAWLPLTLHHRQDQRRTWAKLRCEVKNKTHIHLVSVYSTMIAESTFDSIMEHAHCQRALTNPTGISLGLLV